MGERDPRRHRVVQGEQVPVFCYSPLERGFISRTYSKAEDIPHGDFKKGLPRFQGEAFRKNLTLVNSLDELSREKGMKTTQLALAWLTNISPYVILVSLTRSASADPTSSQKHTSAGTRGRPTPSE